MRILVLSLVYLMFLLSGAAALVYEVLWVRYLSLIFGGSHLAVTTVLSVFMGGLALGGYLVGKKMERYGKLLRLYGLLELGIAFSAVLFAGLMKLYPSVYVPLARVAPESPVYLSFVRVGFAAVAMILPTTLMGGTLPVLSGFVSRRAKGLGGHLSFLYGFNTLGAVIGVAAAGFLFLRYLPVSLTLYIAVLVNVTIGLLGIALQDKAEAALGAGEAEKESARQDEPVAETAESETGVRFSMKLVLWGIGVSGFCALGYEILWTRILSIVVGASVYGFTTMLAAFLLGIAAGSGAYGLFSKLSGANRKGAERPPRTSVIGFGLVQMVIGAAALLVTLYLRDLPAHTIALQRYFRVFGLDLFGARQMSSFALAFLYMVVPAFFMGLAFPLAGKVHALHRNLVGRAVGEVLAFNTVGAILGAAVSGFVLVFLLGIERSLQTLTLVNVGFGLLVVASTMNRKSVNWGVAGVFAAVMTYLAVSPGAFRMWEMKYFAIYRTNQPEAFRTPEMVQDALENTDVLYYAEGVQAIVSSIRVKGGHQAFLTNGRVEASTHNEGLQCQYTLGHLPMLLHRNPKKVFVLGTGSGMTLGATSVHPGVEEIVLAEIEPKVIGVARTFAEYNHNALDHPRLRIVMNDGRNFLLTTEEKFDVITADPIHPWFGGAGYLYTTEYFRLAAERLRPGGIVCQWLPIYELTSEDLRSIVRTFRENFRHVMVWLTHNDAELIGSNSPIVIDEAELERRISEPEIARDLKRVMMGTAEDFLSYFVMGTEGARVFSDGGILNTDDNLYLEFSAPLSVGKASLMEQNVVAIARRRESVLPYLRPPDGEAAQAEQRNRWGENERAARIANRAQAVFLGERQFTPEFRVFMEELQERHPLFAPWRFLRNEYLMAVERQPRLLGKSEMALISSAGIPFTAEISAVRIRISDVRAVVMFADPRAKVVHGQMYVSGPGVKEIDDYIDKFVSDTMAGIQAAYQGEVRAAVAQGKPLPLAEPTFDKVREVIGRKVAKKEVTVK